MADRAEFASRGWTKFAFDPAVAAWAAAARPAAARAEADPANAGWLRCDGTWFAGVGVLPNDTAGRVGDGPPLAGHAVDFAAGLVGAAFAWDAGQVSVCHPGYPRPGAEESAAAARYRRERDGAHLDGLLPFGPGRRRRIGELHGFILGLPLTVAPPEAAPFVIWEGSHEVMRRALAAALADAPPARWGEVDVTETYHAARRECFETLPRVEIAAAPGEAYVAHRLSLHGVAPWRAAPEGKRAVAYFRPDPFLGRAPEWWLDAN